MKKWPMSIPTFELLATVHDQKVVEINTKFVELTWHRILARMLLCSNNGQSYFWQKSAGVLLSTFIIKVIKTKVFTDSLGLNYMQIINLQYLQDILVVCTCLTILFAIIIKKEQYLLEIEFFIKKADFRKQMRNFNPFYLELQTNC